jgi:hypothetical protein
MGQLSADLVVQDAVIPKRFLGDLLQLVYREADAVNIPVVNVFHAGDGNLHPNFLFDSRQPGELEKVEAISKRFMQRVVEVGGTLSGEHGIGNDKSAYMPLVFGPDATRMQLAVPAVFNADHRLNPLKVFRQRRFAADIKQSATNAELALPALASRNSQVPSQPNGDIPSRDIRCFSEFFDPIDGVLCVSATQSLAAINELAARNGLRFPLVLDAQASLHEQLAASGFAPASSRFGGFCDNILGMNWRQPSGRIVRVGERVAKTTTGYDLLRFFLNAPGRFGQPLDFVLRLRPDCGYTGTFYLAGDMPALLAATSDCLSQWWMHWLESIDLLAESGNCKLRLTVHCPPAEWPIFERFSQSIAVKHRLDLTSTQYTQCVGDGLPDLAIKTTPEHVRTLIDKISSSGNFRTVALCYCGIIHGYFVGNVVDRCDILESMVNEISSELNALGGDWQSRHLQPPVPRDLERVWIERFQEAADLQ